MINAKRVFKDAMDTSVDNWFVKENLSRINDRIRRCKDLGMVKTKYMIRDDCSVSPLRKNASYQRMIEKLKRSGYLVNIQGEEYRYASCKQYAKLMEACDDAIINDDGHWFNGIYLYISWDKRKENE